MLRKLAESVPVDNRKNGGKWPSDSCLHVFQKNCAKITSPLYIEHTAQAVERNLPWRSKKTYSVAKRNVDIAGNPWWGVDSKGQTLQHHRPKLFCLKKSFQTQTL